MKKILEKINNYKYIVIVIKDSSFIGHLASANALYTYFLQLHKKVSLYSEFNEYALNLQFLPWIGKLKTSYPASADVKIDAISSIDLWDYFQKNEIKLNAKMTTSLYAGLLYETDGFKKNISDAKVFLMAQNLLESGADVELCTKNILEFQSLCSLRLKGILLTKMVLKENAILAEFDLNDEDLKMSGARVEDASIVIKEALSLATVKKVIIKYKNKIIRSECE